MIPPDSSESNVAPINPASGPVSEQASDEKVAAVPPPAVFDYYQLPEEDREPDEDAGLWDDGDGGARLGYHVHGTGCSLDGTGRPGAAVAWPLLLLLLLLLFVLGTGRARRRAR